MEQLYVDRYYSIHERLQYKKQSRKSGSHHVRPIDGFNRNWHCGHDPIYLGHYAHQITLRGTMLEFFYRVAVINPDRSVRLEDRQQVLEVPT